MLEDVAMADGAGFPFCSVVGAADGSDRENDDDGAALLAEGGPGALFGAMITRRHELRRFHDRKPRSETFESSHALVDDGNGGAVVLEVPPHEHGPHVRAMRMLGYEVATIAPLGVGGHTSKVREEGG